MAFLELSLPETLMSRIEMTNGFDIQMKVILVNHVPSTYMTTIFLQFCIGKLKVRAVTKKVSYQTLQLVLSKYLIVIP